jgi:membrane associated rhomboid family serine protease
MLILPIRTECETRRSPVVNTVLIAVNLACFLAFHPAFAGEQAALFRRTHLVFQSDDPALTQFVTYQFMHADVLHLAANLVFLWVFGNAVNGKFGQLPYLLFYLAGGIFAAWVHGWLHPEGTSLVGASGAIAAVTTAYLVLFPRSHVTVIIWIVVFIQSVELPALAFIGLKIIVWDNIVAPGLRGAGQIAHDAHLAGYLIGFVVSMTMLLIRALPRDQFDMLALWKRWHQRRQFAAAMSDPRAAARAQFGSVAKLPAASASQIAADEKRLDEISAVRDQISAAIARQDHAAAAGAYDRLLTIDPNQSLSERSQLTVAREYYSRRDFAKAAAAFERFLVSFPRSMEAINVRLLLGIIFARDLRLFDRADEVLSSCLNSLRDNERRAQCVRWLRDARAAQGKPSPDVSMSGDAVVGNGA